MVTPPLDLKAGLGVLLLYYYLTSGTDRVMLAMRCFRAQGSFRPISVHLLGVTRRHCHASTSSWPSVAIVGVGQLGAAVAGNLLRNNVNLTLFDLKGDSNVPPALKTALHNATWASSAKEAAQSAEVVITALPKPHHVTAAMQGDDGILAGLRKGSIWIEHSTTDFENTGRLRELVEAKGGHAVEAPLTGGMQILRAGKMVTLVGADPAVFEGKIADLVALSAPRIVRCGDFGHATIIKIFSNILCAVHDVAIGEALCVCKKAGLDMKLVFDAMRVSSGNSFCWETEVPRMLKGDYYPDFTAEMMHKDISLGLALGEKYGVPQWLNEFTAKQYEKAMEKYGGDSGSSIPCRLVEEAAGIRLIEGEAQGDIYPGNTLAPESHGGAFKNWSYTTEILDGSYTVIHTGYDNPYNNSDEAELARLKEKVAELEAKLGKAR